MLKEFDDLISTLCANSSIVRKERDGRLFFTIGGILFDSSGTRQTTTASARANAQAVSAQRCEPRVRQLRDMSWCAFWVATTDGRMGGRQSS